jgi:predicted ATP-dependent endonuclease of OLD family
MRLIKAKVTGYRSVIDSGYFDIETLKTILVGPNEAGKTAILQALQKLNPPQDAKLFDPLRDYPRSKYAEDIDNAKINLNKFTVVEGHFVFTDEEKNEVPDGYKDAVFIYGRYLDNKIWYQLKSTIQMPLYGDIENDLQRLSIHIKNNYEKSLPLQPAIASTNPTALTQKPQDALSSITQKLQSTQYIDIEIAKNIVGWMTEYFEFIKEGSAEENRYNKLKNILSIPQMRLDVIEICKKYLPKFILFNNYYRVKPSIHLANLAQRIATKVLDDDQYDYGNICLLKFLGFNAQELSQAGSVALKNTTPEELQKYKDILDKRDYRLNAASIRLSDEIKRIWNPNTGKGEASKLRIKADGQYLKVVVEDSLGVEVELDQRSEGFQWLVSFFVVFFSEASGEHKNAILLLDEPGLSLHGLKQAEFRETLSCLSAENQTIFTTHSPFLVGANELDIVRVVEMLSRETGTIVHTTVTAGDSAALLPLQEALGYDLAQSMFIHKKNLILEGLTDYWYIEAISALIKAAGGNALDETIALIPANCAGKVVYYATILHAQNLKVAALLDSDTEGDLAANQETLVNALGNKKILRTKDVYTGDVNKLEIEDLLRETLIQIAKDDLKWDAEAKANQQKSRPIVDIFKETAKDSFSKYQLAKSFLRWTKDHSYSDLTVYEQNFCNLLIDKINKALK